MLSISCNPPFVSCSGEAIEIDISSSTQCQVMTTFNLPQVNGEPVVFFESCTEETCCKRHFEAGSEIMLLQNENKFRRKIDPTKKQYFEISVRGDQCQTETCCLPFHSKMLKNCSEPKLLGIRHPDASKSMSFGSAISAGLLSFLLLVIIGMLIAFVKWKKHHRQPRNDLEAEGCQLKPIKSMSDGASSVFIVFTDDHPSHKDVVLKFATLLEADYGFKVVLELYDREKVYTDPTAWLEKSLHADKILVIWSPGAEYMMKSNQADLNQYNMFLPVLKKIKEDVITGKDLSKYGFVCFEYCSKDILPTNACFQSISRLLSMHKIESFLLMNNQGEKDEDEKWEKQSKNYTLSQSDYSIAFHEALMKMSSLARNNPDWFLIPQNLEKL